MRLRAAHERAVSCRDEAFARLDGHAEVVAAAVEARLHERDLGELEGECGQVSPEELGLGARSEVSAGLLSYSDQRSLEIGMSVASSPCVVLLDEPTAGMSRTETERAVDLVMRVTAGRTLLMVEHDMSVVFGLADRISVLVNGSMLFTGTPDEVRNNRDVRAAYLGDFALAC